MGIWTSTGISGILAMSFASILYKMYSVPSSSEIRLENLDKDVFDCPVSLTDSNHPSLLEDIFEIDAGFNPLARMQIMKALLENDVNAEIETLQAYKLMKEIKSDFEKLESSFSIYSLCASTKES